MRGWVLVCGLAGPSLFVARAAEGGAVKRVSPLREAQGTVRAVDPRRGTVELELNGHRALFRVGEETVILFPDHQGTLEDLRPGQEVRVIYQVGGPEPLLEWLELSTAGAPR